MPYYVSNDNPDCSGWAVEKDDGEVIGCHRTRQDAIDQMIAVSLAEDIEPGGVRAVKAYPDLTPPQGVREEARRGLDWRREYNRGGTAVGVARARDLANGRTLTIETVRRMLSYFARHEVDKQGEGWSPDQDGYPSAGRIAWALWGGDPGWSWARRVNAAWEAEVERTTRSGTGERMNIKRLSSSAKIEFKSAEETGGNGEVTALVSVFDNVDLVGERVMKGAFKKSLEQYAKNGRSIPFVWSHQWENPDYYIGAVREAQETDEGLLVRAELFDSPTAKHIRTLMKEGVVTEFSFAYDIKAEGKGKDGVRELKELHILEVGPTLKGANPATRLVGVRSAQAAKAEPGELEEGSFVEWAGGYGRVEYIMVEGTFGVEGDPMSLVASEDDPLALVREYENEEGEWMPTDKFSGHRFSELTAVDEIEAQVEEPTEERTGAKAGRVLSSKNETRIKDAVSLLQDVLGSLPADDASKSEEPLVKDEANVDKTEHKPLDAATAQLILELETEIE
jgi:HK97 family phage prohead protease